MLPWQIAKAKVYFILKFYFKFFMVWIFVLVTYINPAENNIKAI